MITLRLATISDIPLIQEVAESTWPVSYKEIISPEQIRYMLDNMYNDEKIREAISDANQAFWLAEENGKTLGFCGIEHRYSGKAITRIHKLYILPDTQGSGLGKIFMDHIEKEARKRKSTKLHLNVNKQNRAFGFYQKQGFITDHEEVLHIGNGFVMDDFVMTKQLD